MTHPIALPYSKALFQLAASKKELQESLHAIEQFLDLLQKKPDLKQIFLHPFIEKEEKKRLLKKIEENQIPSFLLSFLFLLIDEKRFDQLEGIVQGYRQMVYDQLQMIQAEVVTAVPLDEKNKERLKNKLETFYQKKVDISLRVDPQIIGGMVLMIGDQILDKSIKNQLMQLERALICH